MTKRIIGLLIFLAMLLAAAALAEDPILVESVTPREEAMRLVVGRSGTVRMTVAPGNAKNRTLLWSSSDENVVTVNSQGQVKAVAPGIAVITAAAQDGSGAKGTVEITVYKPVDRITLDSERLTLPPDTSWQLLVTIEPADATYQNLEWTSEDESVATADEFGVIHTHGVGKCTLTANATDGSHVRARVFVTVQEFDAVFTQSGAKEVDFHTINAKSTETVTDSKGTHTVRHVRTVAIKYGLVTVQEDGILVPVRPGYDEINVQEKKDKTVVFNQTYKIFVDRKIYGQQYAGEDAEILFWDIPWGTGYTELNRLVKSRGLTLRPMIMRNGRRWTQIRKELLFGTLTSFRNGLSFSGPESARLEERSALVQGDFYFAPEIPFRTVRETVMGILGLQRNDTTDSLEYCEWRKGDVTVRLTSRERYTLLEIVHDADTADDSPAEIGTAEEEPVEEETVPEEETTIQDGTDDSGWEDEGWDEEDEDEDGWDDDNG